MSAYVRQPAVGRADRQLALSIACILLGLYTATFSSVADDPEAEIQFQTTSALARSGRPALGGTPEAAAIVAEAERRAGDFPVRQGPRGRWYSLYGIGSALVGLPFYGLGQLAALAWPGLEEGHATAEGGLRSEYFAHLAVGWRNALLTALLGALVFATARRLDASRRSAWIAGVTFGAATFAWPLARSSLADVEAAFLLFLAFHLVVFLRETFQRLRAPRARTLLLLGLALGLALLTRPSAWLAVVVLVGGAFAVLRAGRGQFRVSPTEQLRKRSEKLRWLSAALAVPILACLALLLLLDRERTGDPLATLRLMLTSDPLREGLRDELLAPGNGLLWLAPGLLLFPLGFLVAWREGERLWPLMFVGVGLAVALPETVADGWHLTPTYGPRDLLPLLPFAWLGVALALDKAESRFGLRIAAVTLFLIGVLGAVPAVLVDAGTYRDLAQQAALAEARSVGGEGDAAVAGEGAAPSLAELHWDWRFAAPWAYWRILRHRVSGGGDEFDARELFAVSSDVPLTPRRERDRGFRHLHFVDLSLRLGGPGWAVLAFAVTLTGIGLALASRGFQPGRA